MIHCRLHVSPREQSQQLLPFQAVFLLSVKCKTATQQLCVIERLIKCVFGGVSKYS